MKSFKRIFCRGCGSPKLKLWLDLGDQPPANNLIGKGIGEFTEYVFPLKVYFCQDCTLVQLLDVVDPKLLFDDYLYHSSTAESFKNHFRNLAKDLVTNFKLKPGDLVVDIGSNDGILLKPLQELGVRVLGVDPAQEIAIDTTIGGIPTLPYYFNSKRAKQMVDQYGRAKIVTACNVFAHIDDMVEIFKGLDILLDDNGTLVMEVAYMPQMLTQNTFDLIYHEHLCYYTAYSLSKMAEKNGFLLHDVELISVHGGSLRAFIKRAPKRGQSLAPTYRAGDLIHKDKNILEFEAFQNFPQKVMQIKVQVKEILNKIPKSKKVIGYGAPAKMSTMTNYFNIDQELIDYIIDDSEFKNGYLSPGKHIPIFKELDIKDPHYIFIFAWNYAEAIMKKLRAVGYEGKFIVPFPEVKILS